MAFPHRTAAVSRISRRGGPAARAAIDGRRPAAGAAAAEGGPSTRRRANRRPRSPPQRRNADATKARAIAAAGRAGRMARRARAHAERRAVPHPHAKPFEVLDEEGLAIIEHNADTILQEVGIEFRGYPEALELCATPAPTSQGERVRFPRGLCRPIVQASAPRDYTQYARNPERNVQIGDMTRCSRPNYGSPFVRDLDRGRRYGTIEDFRNFVKLTYMSPYLHHSGGTVCEPVDVPVNKRHLDMVYSHIRYSDKPFMGSVTAPVARRDSVELARIAFGEDYLQDHTVI